MSERPSGEIGLRPFHPSDLGDLEGSSTLNPAFGLTAVRNGVAIGYAGLHFFGGRAWVFFHSRDPAIRRGMFLHRLVVRWLAAARALGVMEMWAYCDMRWPGAEAWLLRLGFRPAKEEEKDEAIVAAEKATGQRAWKHVGR